MTDTLSKAAISFERIGEILAIESQVRDRPGARPAPPFTGRIEFAHVRVRLHAGPGRCSTTSTSSSSAGQRAALVGLTGSGKSTLIGLIPRLYDVRGGQVCIDGRDVRSYTLESLRQQVSFVLQDAVLFRAIGRPEHRLRQARRDARRDRAGGQAGATPTSSSRGCRRATTPSSASAATRCRAASASASRSPAPSSATRRSCCSTSRRRRSIRSRRQLIFEGLLDADGGQDVDHHRPSPGDGAQRRRHLRAGRRRDRRAGHPRGAAREGRSLLADLYRIQFNPASSSSPPETRPVRRDPPSQALGKAS